MHAAEEVRKEADCFRHIKGDARTREMLLAYARLLEAMEEVHAQQIDLGMEGKGTVEVIRQRADEKARGFISFTPY